MIQFNNENVTIFQSELYKTTTTVIHTHDVIIVVDPNWLPSEVMEIREYVNSIKVNQIMYMIFTHSDFDHIIGAGAFPEAKVIASEAFQKHAYKQEVLAQIHQFDQKYYLKRTYPIIFPEVDIVVTHDKQELRIGELTLTFFLAPGHTEDGVFTFVEPYGIFIAGDYLSDVEFPFIFERYHHYVETIRKAEVCFKEQTVQLLIPGHGTMTSTKAEMKKRFDESNEYLKGIKQDNTKQLEEKLQQRYSFYDGMKSIHVENKKKA